MASHESFLVYMSQYLYIHVSVFIYTCLSIYISFMCIFISVLFIVYIYYSITFQIYKSDTTVRIASKSKFYHA